VNQPKTPLHVAHALRTAADEIVKPTFPRCYGDFARAEDGSNVQPNDPAATEWCATGRILHLLGFEATYDLLAVPDLHKIRCSQHPDDIIKHGDAGFYDAATAISALWVPFDKRMPHEAAARMRRIATRIETYVNDMEAPNAPQEPRHRATQNTPPHAHATR
jgi:hypothetical protein